MCKSVKLAAAILLSLSVDVQAKTIGDCVANPKANTETMYAMSQPSPTGLITKKLDNIPSKVLAVSTDFILISAVEEDKNGKHTCRKYGWVSDSAMMKLPLEKCVDKQNVCK